MSGSSKYVVNPLVLVATPTLEHRPISWAWMDSVSALQFPLGASVSRYRVHGKDVAEARNDIVQTALGMNADYILFIGDDNLPPPNLFNLLHRHRKDLVTGVYWTKQFPSSPYIWRGLLRGPFVDWKYGEFCEVDFAGVDALLAHTDVFRAIDPPWFSREWVFEPGQVPLPHLTEDFFFYSLAREKGYRLWCDTAAQLGHQDRATGAIFGLDPSMPQMRKDVSPPSQDPEILVADIGAGIDSPWFGAHATIKRYDIDPSTRPDVRCDIRAIPEPDETFDVVTTRHTLEHFMWEECPALIREWTRILKVGGHLRINVPNLAYAAREIVRADDDPDYSPGLYPLWQVYGKQVGNFGEVHRNGFLQKSLHRLLEHCGLTDVEVIVSGELGENLDARAVKPAVTPPLALGPLWRDIEARERPASAEPVAPIPEPAITTREAVDRINGLSHTATDPLVAPGIRRP